MGLASPDGKLLRSADACDDIFTLRIYQKLTVELILSGGRITCESNTSGTVIAHVSEDHGLHVHGGAPPLRDVVQGPRQTVTTGYKSMQPILVSFWFLPRENRWKRYCKLC